MCVCVWSGLLCGRITFSLVHAWASSVFSPLRAPSAAPLRHPTPVNTTGCGAFCVLRSVALRAHLTKKSQEKEKEDKLNGRFSDAHKERVAKFVKAPQEAINSKFQGLLMRKARIAKGHVSGINDMSEAHHQAMDEINRWYATRNKLGACVARVRCMTGVCVLLLLLPRVMLRLHECCPGGASALVPGRPGVAIRRRRWLVVGSMAGLQAPGRKQARRVPT